jgi:hypothetical protein
MVKIMKLIILLWFLLMFTYIFGYGPGSASYILELRNPIRQKLRIRIHNSAISLKSAFLLLNAGSCHFSADDFSPDRLVFTQLQMGKLQFCGNLRKIFFLTHFKDFSGVHTVY